MSRVIARAVVIVCLVVIGAFALSPPAVIAIVIAGGVR